MIELLSALQLMIASFQACFKEFIVKPTPVRMGVEPLLSL